MNPIADFSDLKPLDYETTGSGNPLFFVHGFSQTGISFDPLTYEIRKLEDQSEMLHSAITTVDLPGHGGSSEIIADSEKIATLLKPLGSGTWLGYSQGARSVLLLALNYPTAVKKLVLISSMAGIKDALLRRQRYIADENLASELEIGGDQGIPEFIDRWLSGPLFSNLRVTQEDLEARLKNSAKGLASSLRYAGQGAYKPVWDRLHELSDRGLKVLLVSGGDDEKYSEYASEMASLITTSASKVIGSAGHAVHLEKPKEVAQLIFDFHYDIT